MTYSEHASIVVEASFPSLSAVSIDVMPLYFLQNGERMTKKTLSYVLQKLIVHLQGSDVSEKGRTFLSEIMYLPVSARLAV